MAADADRWSDWLDGDGSEKYRRILAAIEDYVVERSKGAAPAYYYTPHDATHCRAVEKMAKALVRKSDIHLSEVEKFLLFASVWTHDLGMLESIASRFEPSLKPPEVRERHERISAIAIMQDPEFERIFTDREVSDSLFRAFAHTINIVSRFHRRRYEITDCPEERFVREYAIRTRLLAAIVRFADTLHIDSTRYDRYVYDILQIGDFDVTARLHWLKSYVVSSVHLDIDRQTIAITMDLPEEEIPGVRWDRDATSLMSVIHQSVFEDLVSVAGVFKEYCDRFYGLVDVRVDYCPGFEKEKAAEIVSVVNDLDTLLSPNTSKVIDKALASIEALTVVPFKHYELFHRQLGQLADHLATILADRPCHVGLAKILEMLQEEIGGFPAAKAGRPSDIKTCGISLIERVAEIRAQRENALDQLARMAGEVLSGIRNVLLFGYSDMVSSMLEAVGEEFKSNARVYVFECGGKRRLSTTNGFQYNDGVRYAERISSLGFRDVAILPDTSFASLLEDAKGEGLDPRETVLLFGANGVDASGNCAHTSGHLLLALAAEHYEVPVKVVADEFKRGSVRWRPDLLREGAAWLTGEKQVVDRLKKAGIRLLDYREDKIPADLLSIVWCDAAGMPDPDEEPDAEAAGAA